MTLAMTLSIEHIGGVFVFVVGNMTIMWEK